MVSGSPTAGGLARVFQARHVIDRDERGEGEQQCKHTRADIADPPVKKGEGEREQTAHRGAVNGHRRQQAGRALHAAADELLVAVLMLLGGGGIVAFGRAVMRLSGRFGCRVLLLEGDGATDLRLAEDLGHAEAEQAGDQSRDHAADE